MCTHFVNMEFGPCDSPELEPLTFFSCLEISTHPWLKSGPGFTQLPLNISKYFYPCRSEINVVPHLTRGSS